MCNFVNELYITGNEYIITVWYGNCTSVKELRVWYGMGIRAHANTPVLGQNPNGMGPLVAGKMSGGASTLAFAVLILVYGMVCVKTKTKMCRGDKKLRIRIYV